MTFAGLYALVIFPILIPVVVYTHATQVCFNSISPHPLTSFQSQISFLCSHRSLPFHQNIRSVCGAHAPFVLNELRSKELNYVHKCIYKVDSIQCDTAFSAVESGKRKRGHSKGKTSKICTPTCTAHAYAFTWILRNAFAMSTTFTLHRSKYKNWMPLKSFWNEHQTFRKRKEKIAVREWGREESMQRCWSNAWHREWNEWQKFLCILHCF